MDNPLNSSCPPVLTVIPRPKVFFFDLPEGSRVTGDKAYTDYVIEDALNEAKSSLAFAEEEFKTSCASLGSLL